MAGLAKGLAILECFGSDAPQLTLAEAARAALPRSERREQARAGGAEERGEIAGAARVVTELAVKRSRVRHAAHVGEMDGAEAMCGERGEEDESGGEGDEVLDHLGVPRGQVLLGDVSGVRGEHRRMGARERPQVEQRVGVDDDRQLEAPEQRRFGLDKREGLTAQCRACHTAVYDRWKSTRMANVVRDPKAHPEAIIPDFSKPDPLLTFTRDDIAFVYGTKWKQRYFKKVGDDYYPLPAQWDITNKVWRAYMVQTNTDWWVSHYPADNMQRPTGPLCDGCHSVNYNIQTKAVTEWNVGCERCHGPGSAHVTRPSRANIVNPARLDSIRANDVCIQCHSQGQPLNNPIAGKYYDWPVGFDVTKNLKDFWKLEEHKLGETTFTHFGDGTAHKNRMQGNDFVQSQMYTHGVTCFSCHDVHGTGNNADLLKPASTMFNAAQIRPTRQTISPWALG